MPDALLGAGGASYYSNNGDALAPLRSIPGIGLFGVGSSYAPQWPAGVSGGSGSNREMEDLKRMVSCSLGVLAIHCGYAEGFAWSRGLCPGWSQLLCLPDLVESVQGGYSCSDDNSVLALGGTLLTAVLSWSRWSR